MMITFRSLLSLLIVFQLLVPMSASAGASQKPEKDYWKDTELTFDTLSQALTSKCYNSVTYFVGCVNAVGVLANMMNPPRFVATDAEVAVNPYLGTQERKIGKSNLGLYRLSENKAKMPTSRKAEVQLEQNILAIHERSVEALFSEKKKQINFDQLVSELKSTIITTANSDLEPMIVGHMLNKAFEVIYDPHTQLWPQAREDDLNSPTQDSFVGVGISMGRAPGGKVKVQYVHESGGAYEAGVRYNDILVGVKQENETEFTVIGSINTVEDYQKIRSKLLGTEGTKVIIQVVRNGETLSIPIVRKQITTKNVNSKLVNDTGTPYGYIRLASFMQDTAAKEINNALKALISQGAQGIILDLRGNGGGRLELAIQIGSFFVGAKTITIVKELKDGKLTGVEQTLFNPSAFRGITNLPMVTLIDGESASASELVAGALQDHKRSWIVGDRSFGKGTVQGVEPFDFGKNLNFRKTIARFYQPTGRTNQIHGIIPDYYVDPFPGATDDDKAMLREGDAYSKLIATEGEPWVQTRPDEVAQINDCRSRTSKANEIYKTANGINPADYRLLVAEDILNCTINPQ